VLIAHVVGSYDVVFEDERPNQKVEVDKQVSINNNYPDLAEKHEIMTSDHSDITLDFDENNNIVANGSLKVNSKIGFADSIFGDEPQDDVGDELGYRVILQYYGQVTDETKESSDVFSLGGMSLYGDNTHTRSATEDNEGA